MIYLCEIFWIHSWDVCTFTIFKEEFMVEDFYTVTSHMTGVSHTFEGALAVLVGVGG